MGPVKGIVHFEIHFWYTSRASKTY